MIPLSVPDLRGREAEYLARCVEDNWVSSAGPFVTQLESEMAKLAGCRYAVATMNGTAALHLALVTAGVREDEYVIVPDFTFAATANAVYHAGARPLFVDVSSETWTLAPDSIEDAMTFARKRGLSVGAVIAVHVLGQPADMDSIKAVCRRAGVALVEDAAGAIGATYRGGSVGALGDIGVFSFNGNKTVTAGGGGMILTDREDWAQHARHLSTQARATAEYSFDEVGFNYRMTNLNAAVGLAQLERLEEMLEAKRETALAYDQAIADRNDMRPMPQTNLSRSSHWLYGVRVASTDAARSLVDHLARRGIEAKPFWRALSQQTAYVDAISLETPITATLSGQVVTIPSSSNLTARDRASVISALTEWRGPQLDG